VERLRSYDSYSASWGTHPNHGVSSRVLADMELRTAALLVGLVATLTTGCNSSDQSRATSTTTIPSASAPSIAMHTGTTKVRLPHVWFRPRHGRPGTAVHLVATNCFDPAGPSARQGRFEDAGHVHGPADPFHLQSRGSTLTGVFVIPLSAANGRAWLGVVCSKVGNTNTRSASWPNHSRASPTVRGLQAARPRCRLGRLSRG
jgi:hypothetical protein